VDPDPSSRLLTRVSATGRLAFAAALGLAGGIVASLVTMWQGAALIGWARRAGEGSDYTDNVPAQCLHPVGHWYEVSNLLRNGVLLKLLQERPRLKYLLAHNIDSLGADLNPALLGLHIDQGAALSFEVMASSPTSISFIPAGTVM